MSDRGVAEDGVRINLAVIISVNPQHPSLLRVIAESEGRYSIADVLRSEIESNLKSLGYVTRVTVQPV